MDHNKFNNLTIAEHNSILPYIIMGSDKGSCRLLRVNNIQFTSAHELCMCHNKIKSVICTASPTIVTCHFSNISCKRYQCVTTVFFYLKLLKCYKMLQKLFILVYYGIIIKYT